MDDSAIAVDVRGFMGNYYRYQEGIVRDKRFVGVGPLKLFDLRYRNLGDFAEGIEGGRFAKATVFLNGRLEFTASSPTAS